jgi:hypothetical protein
MISITLEHLEGKDWVEQEIKLDVDADMGLSDETLDQDMCAMPRVIAYYAELSAELYAQAARYKQRMEVSEAVASQACRKYAQSTGEKITEGGIREQVTLNGEVQETRAKYWTADAQHKKLDGFYRALREKASLAIAICYKQKEEIRVMNSPLT